jgi:acetylornithine aminotransferase
MEGVRGLPGVQEVRGRGLMIGIEMEEPAEPIRKTLLYDEHIFTGAAGKHTIRLLPSLALGREDAGLFLEKFRAVLQQAPVRS